ncbi:MAG: DUF3558 domain-containing protein [Actinomycetota bacterium]|nr:DUF3558 domain-containing protein [Actinomycetota bacterium]
MNVRDVVVAVVSVCVMGAVAACESTATGTPTPESGVSVPSGTSTSDEPGGLAPPIEDPKGLAGIDPCDLLTESQLAALTIVKPGTKEVSAWGEAKCNWENSTVSVGLAPDTQRDGLEGTYRRRHRFDNFEESEVDGYPAVRTDFATQVCSIVVGVADNQALTVHYTRMASDSPGKGDPCSFAESITSTVLTNLPDA